MLLKLVRVYVMTGLLYILQGETEEEEEEMGQFHPL